MLSSPDKVLFSIGKLLCRCFMIRLALCLVCKAPVCLSLLIFFEARWLRLSIHSGCILQKRSLCLQVEQQLHQGQTAGRDQPRLGHQTQSSTPLASTPQKPMNSDEKPEKGLEWPSPRGNLFGSSRMQRACV